MSLAQRTQRKTMRFKRNPRWEPYEATPGNLAAAALRLVHWQCPTWPSASRLFFHMPKRHNSSKNTVLAPRT